MYRDTGSQDYISIGEGDSPSPRGFVLTFAGRSCVCFSRVTNSQRTVQPVRPTYSYQGMIGY
jgi:hypothetical protein